MNAISAVALGAILLVAGADTAPGALPLRRGVYVDVATGCHGAVSAARSWFGGGYVIQAPHAHCEMKSVTRPGPDRYAVTAQCYENGDRSMPFEKVDQVTIVSHTEYTLDNAYGHFQARWCRG
jgi:hypothetical protein